MRDTGRRLLLIRLLSRRSLPVGRNPQVRTIDTLPALLQTDNPSEITYAIEVLNADGRGAALSNQIRVSLFRTLPPPQDFVARVTGQGIVLTWTNDLPPAGSAQNVRYVYRVYRRAEGSQQQTLAGELPLGSDRGFTLTDANIEWEKAYEYRVEIVGRNRSGKQDGD